MYTGILEREERRWWEKRCGERNTGTGYTKGILEQDRGGEYGVVIRPTGFTKETRDHLKERVIGTGQWNEKKRRTEIITNTNHENARFKGKQEHYGRRRSSRPRERDIKAQSWASFPITREFR